MTTIELDTLRSEAERLFEQKLKPQNDLACGRVDDEYLNKQIDFVHSRRNGQPEREDILYLMRWVRWEQSHLIIKLVDKLKQLEVGITGKVSRQITQCQTPDLPYLAYHPNADRRTAEGQRQTHCAVCQRWQWEDKRCELFAASEPQPVELD